MLINVNCRLLFITSTQNKYFQASFLHKNCCGQFLSAYFSFWEILNLNPTFAVNVVHALT